MDQRLSLVTLGVSDVPAARAFYEALGWTCNTDPALDVAFFQLGGIVLAVWDRQQLAEDSTVSDRGGFGGVTLAYNVRTPEEVDAVLAEAEARGRHDRQTWREDVLGRLLGCVHRPRRPSVGGRPQPALDDRGRRLGADLSSLPTGGESWTQPMKAALRAIETVVRMTARRRRSETRNTTAATDTRNAIVIRMFCASHCHESS